jgi:uncharacterized protein Yka (UPF0111/DUF47 family)
MTDMINGAFMEDLSKLLNSATGDQRRRKTFYEIDTEFEKMTASLLKNFNSMASLMPFLRASLRQTMIRKLASVGKDKDGWKKADEHLTTLMDQEHGSCETMRANTFIRKKQPIFSYPRV